MYATRSRKVKTDRRDARALAEPCLLGAYRPTHRLSDLQRHVRGRLLVRDAVVRTRTRATARSSGQLRRADRAPPVQDPRVPRLRSVPSGGPVTAAAFIAAIDDA